MKGNIFTIEPMISISLLHNFLFPSEFISISHHISHHFLITHISLLSVFCVLRFIVCAITMTISTQNNLLIKLSFENEDISSLDDESYHRIAAFSGLVNFVPHPLHDVHGGGCSNHLHRLSLLIPLLFLGITSTPLIPKCGISTHTHMHMHMHTNKNSKLVPFSTHLPLYWFCFALVLSIPPPQHLRTITNTTR